MTSPDRRQCECLTQSGARCRSRKVAPYQCCSVHLPDDIRKSIRETYGRPMDVPTEPACWSWDPPRTLGQIRADLERINPPEIVALYADLGDGLIFDDFHRGRCAICGTTVRADVDDHDHATGLSRGKLCRSCNVSEGRSDAQIFVNYRERNPASILGLRIPYSGYGWTDGTPSGGWIPRREIDDPDTLLGLVEVGVADCG